MPDYLSSLIERSRRSAGDLVPRPRALFEARPSEGLPVEPAGEAQPESGMSPAARPAVEGATRAGPAVRPVPPPAFEDTTHPVESETGRTGRVDERPAGIPADRSPARPAALPVEPRPVLDPEPSDRPGVLMPRPAPTLPAVRRPDETSGTVPASVRPAAAPEPVVRVTIGRLEVQAILPTPPPAGPGRGGQQPPALSLDDYLKQRREGER